MPVWLTWTALKALPWRLIAYGGLLAALVAGVLWYRHSLISAGDARGAARIQALWNADEAAEKALADAQIADNAAKEAAAAARNEERERQHQEEVAAAIADRDRVAGLLAAARRAARSGSAAQVDHQPGFAPASEASGIRPADAEAEIDGLIADVIAEHRANASQLNALIGEVVPQMEAP